MNLNGRISIFYTFAWGIISLIFINLVHPFVEKITKKALKKIPEKTQMIIIEILGSVWIIDTIASSIRYLNIV